MVQPPKIPQRILFSFLKPEIAEEVAGDLDEKFFVEVTKKPLWRARLNYWYQCIHYLRPFALKNPLLYRFYSFYMIGNYTKISLRNLKKQKLYSVINIVGLAIGLSAFILMALYVQHEFSYDRHLKNSQQIYRVYQRQIGNEYLASDYFGVTPTLLAGIMPDEFPEVERATHVDKMNSLLTHEDASFWESGLLSDKDFFNVFPYEFIEGNRVNPLDEKTGIVLTESLAKKIFGDGDAVGKALKYNNGDELTVTAVIRNIPTTSTIQFSFVINGLLMPWVADELSRTTWTGNSFFTFFLLAEGADPSALERKLPILHDKYRNKGAYANYPFKDVYFVQPISEMHLDTHRSAMEIGTVGNITHVYLFGVVGVLILLLACVNYMNLAIARSVNRLKEVGMRKVMGAVRKQLIVQFLIDSIMVTLIALLLAFALTVVLLPYFGQLMDRPLSLDVVGDTWLLPGVLVTVLIVGIVSGSYPAFFLSALHPLQVIKSKTQGVFSGVRLQRILTVGQFAISIGLVACSVVIFQQLTFIREQELGYNKENVIVTRVKDPGAIKKMDVVMNQLRQNKNIVDVTQTTELPVNIGSSTIINDEAGEPVERNLAIYRARADEHYLNVFGIELLAGRNFSTDSKADVEEGFIVNETAAEALGWRPEEAIGKQFTYNGTETIIGVVKDFHMHSMHLPMQPLMIQYEPLRGNWVGIKVKSDDLPRTIAFIESTFKEHSPFPFDYNFLDSEFENLYRSDLKLGESFGFFTILSLTIAALGLFGLAAFMAVQRTKEIGIRKVLGASAGNIFVLLTKEFIILIAVGFVISVPASWYGMHRWLQGFAYRIDLQWWMFAGAGIMAVVVAVITVSYQSIRAATVAPVDTLRAE